MLKKLRKALLCLLEPDYRPALIRAQVAAAVEHSKTLALLHYRTVIDVGANRGQFALVARHHSPGVQIICFEPLPQAAEKLRTIFARDRAIVIHQSAVGPMRQQATIHVSKRDDSSSLLPIGAQQSRLFRGTEEETTAVVQVGRIEDFVDLTALSENTLLKIDVQGYELEVLQGCERILDKVSFVYVECSFVELYTGQAFANEVVRWLNERGFRLVGVHNMIYDPRGIAIQGDFLFAFGCDSIEVHK